MLHLALWQAALLLAASNMQVDRKKYPRTDLFPEHLDCRHHGGNVDTSSEGIERNVLLFALCPDSVSNLLQQV